MGRTASDSLKYFPLDVGFIMDKPIQRLRAKFGADGALYYLYILSSAYGGKGYYVEYTEDFIEDAADDLRCSEQKIELMTKYLASKSLLDNKLLSTVNALSSHGIQKQYQAAAKSLRRDIEVDERYWVLDKEETATFIKVRSYANKYSNNQDKSCIYDDKSGVNDINKIKLNKTILKKKEGEETPTVCEPAPSTETTTPPPAACPIKDYTQNCIDYVKQGQIDSANRTFYIAHALNYQCDVDRVYKETGVMLEATMGTPY